MRVCIKATIGFAVLRMALLPAPAAAQPPAATGLAATQADNLNFRWPAVAGATFYQLWLTDASGTTRYHRWSPATDLNCGPGENEICDISLAIALQPGTAHWWVQTWNPTGFGPWSAANTFAGQPEGTTNRTRLLIPYVTNWAGFDTGIAISNTGLDSTGTVGRSGTCSLYYFGRFANGNPANKVETTNAPVAAGAQFTILISSGGGLGLTGNPNFQGYMEVVCNFPFAHGIAFMTDGPIGTARVGAYLPVVVLPAARGGVESRGQ